MWLGRIQSSETLGSRSVRSAGGTARVVALGLLLAACGGKTENTSPGSGGAGSGGSSSGGSSSSGGGGGSTATGGAANGGSEAGCSLALDTGGVLPPPISATARLTGPAVTGTDDGFVIGYRKQEGDDLRAVLSFLKDDGELGPTENFDLQGCFNKQPADGVGMAYAGGYGMMTASLPDCGKGAGAVFIPFTSKGLVGQASGPHNSAFEELWMSQSPIAPAVGEDGWELTYRVLTDTTPVAERVLLHGATFKTTVPIAHPLGDEDVPFIMTATTPQLRAFLAPVPSKGSTVVEVGTRSSDTIDEKGEFTLPQAGWAALTAWGNRVAAAVPAAAGMTVQGANLTHDGAVAPWQPFVVGAGSVLSGAMVVLRSHLLIVQGRNAGITLHRLDSADGALSGNPVLSVDLPGAPGANLATFDGTHVAIAAARDRVLVAWLSKGKLSAGDPPGGWALLRCKD